MQLNPTKNLTKKVEWASEASILGTVCNLVIRLVTNHNLNSTTNKKTHVILKVKVKNGILRLFETLHFRLVPIFAVQKISAPLLYCIAVPIFYCRFILPYRFFGTLTICGGKIEEFEFRTLEKKALKITGVMRSFWFSLLVLLLFLSVSLKMNSRRHWKALPLSPASSENRAQKQVHSQKSCAKILDLLTYCMIHTQANHKKY